MTNEDRERFAVLIEALCSAFGKEPSEALLEAYWIGLGDLDANEVQVAVATSIRQCKFFPAASELRGLAGAMAAADRASRAFAAAKAGAARVGRYSSVSFDDPLINACIRSMGGWRRFCSMPAEELEVWGRKQFEQSYSGFAQAGVSREACEYLPGVSEISNRGVDEWQVEVREISTGLPPANVRMLGLVPQPKQMTDQRVQSLIAQVSQSSKSQ